MKECKTNTPLCGIKYPNLSNTDQLRSGRKKKKLPLLEKQVLIKKIFTWTFLKIGHYFTTKKTQHYFYNKKHLL